MFVSVIYGRPRRRLRCRPGLFLAKVRLLSAEIVQHLFEGRGRREVAYTRRVRGTAAGPGPGGAHNDIFEAHYLASLEKAASTQLELASDRAAELLSLVDAHVAIPAARNCVHWPLTSSVCLG